MNIRRITGLILFIAGIILLIFSIHYMNEIFKAKGIAHDVQNFFSHNPSMWNGLIDFFGGKAQEEVAKYDIPLLVMFISGIFLIFIGSLMGFIRKKRQ